MTFIISKWKNNNHFVACAKKYAKKQSDYFNENGENMEEEISFDCLGQNIINPFYDTTMRFELTTEEAYNYYGIANMDYFVEETYKKEVMRVFYENYVNRYLNEQGYFVAKEVMPLSNGRIRMEFMDTNMGYSPYSLYVNLTSCGELQIWNERNENVLIYAEENEWTAQDIDIIRYGYHQPRNPLTMDELRNQRFYFVKDLLYTNMDIFYENGRYSLEYYDKAKYGYADEILCTSTNKRDIENYLKRYFAGDLKN